MPVSNDRFDIGARREGGLTHVLISLFWAQNVYHNGAYVQHETEGQPHWLPDCQNQQKRGQ